MPLTRSFFVGQDYLGSAPAPLEIVHNETHTPTGQAFFCPICSDIWARALIDGEPTGVRHRACGKHIAPSQFGNSSLGGVHTSEIPGSLMLAESRQWNDSLPSAVVEREFRLHLQWAADAEVIPKVVASMAQDMYNVLYQPRRSK